MFGSQNLTTVKLKGVGESFRKYPDHESKGIKAHFNLDESGVLSLDRVRAGLPARPSPRAFLEYEKREGFGVDESWLSMKLTRQGCGVAFLVVCKCLRHVDTRVCAIA